MIPLRNFLGDYLYNYLTFKIEPYTTQKLGKLVGITLRSAYLSFHEEIVFHS